MRKGNPFPTSSHVLPYTKTLKKEVVDLYEKSGHTVLEWQGNLLDSIMAIGDDGLWTHSKYGYAVPRQNGKNEIITMREMWGLLNGERILHTAHRTSTSHAAWERLVRRLEEAGYVQGEHFTSQKAKGAEKIEFIGSGRIDFRTRTSTGGLGESFDLLVIDEAQEYTDDQESALQYTIAASGNPQTIMCGTPPTMVSSGTVFVNLRTDTLEGAKNYTGWAEWSVEDKSDVRDKDLWYLTNPSLGHFLKERTIESEIQTGEAKEIDFNIQRLGLWLRYNQKSAISETDWERLKVKSIPSLKGKLHVGIKYGKDGNNVALSVAVKTLSGRIFIETIDCQSIRNGNLWIIQFLKRSDVEAVVIDGAGAQSILAKEIEEYGIRRIKVVLPKVAEVITANSKWDQAVFQDQLLHNDQPSLTAVVTNCEKRPIGSQGGFGYKSQYDDRDIALMDSAILAHWSCAEIKQAKKQSINY